MEVVYDIKLINGEMINECYFIEQQRKIKNGLGMTMMVVPEFLRCFIGEEEVLNRDFDKATVIKIYDRISGEDLSDLILGKVLDVSHVLGYSVPFPIPRSRITLE